MLLAPVAQRHQGRGKFLTLLRQDIVVALRSVRILTAFQDARFDKALQHILEAEPALYDAAKLVTLATYVNRRDSGDA